MQVIVLFFISLIFSLGAIAGPLETKINQHEELQQLLQRHCLRNENSRDVKVMVNGTELNCNHLLVLATRLKTEIDDDVEELEESCNQENQPESSKLASQTAQIARQSVCKPQSTDLQCLGSFTCSLASKVGQSIPVFGRPISGMLQSCRGNYSAGGCLQSIAKGIFDALWGLVSSVWDVGRAAVRGIGEWTGIIRAGENSTTEKLMAAQRAGRAYVGKFIRSPIQTMRETAAAIFNGVKQAAMSSYGCEQWADPRRPFVSRCVRPMSNWNCASCQQKFQVMCGIAGMAIGEIPAALLTGGVAGGARAIARAASAAVRSNARLGRVNRGVAGVLSKFRPPAGLSRVTEGIARQTRRLSAVEQRLIARWGTLKDSQLSRLISKSAKQANDGDVREAMRFRLRPVGFYVDAVEAAARLGFKAGDEAVSSVVGNGTRQASAAVDATRVASAAQTGSMSDVERTLPAEAREVTAVNSEDLRVLAGDTVDVSDEIADLARTERVQDVRLIEGAQVVPLVRRFSNNSSTPVLERLPAGLPDPSSISMNNPRPEVKVPEFSADPQLPSGNNNNNNQNNRNAEVKAESNNNEKEESEEDTDRRRRVAMAENEANSRRESAREEVITPVAEPSIVNVEQLMTPDLVRAGSLSVPDRLSEASTLVGRALPQEQTDAIIRAHQIGEGTGRGYFTYTPEEIREKGLILRSAGFTAPEIRLLMDKGITGSAPGLASANSARGFAATNVTAPTPAPIPAAPVQASSRVQNVEFGVARSSVVRGSDIRRSLTQTAPGELQTTRLNQMRSEYKTAADGYAIEASRVNSPQFVGQSMWLYAKAGDSRAAVQMAQLGVRQHGMSSEQILRGIDRELTHMKRDLSATPNNPGLVIEHDTLVEVRRVLTSQNAPAAAAPARIVVQSRTSSPASAAPAAPVVSAAPVRAPAPAVVATRPTAPPPTSRNPSSVQPREAAAIANELRLAGNSSEASRFYFRASLNDMIQEARRTKGASEGSRYFENRNLSAAFHESLNGDGVVAKEMISSLAIEGKGSAINEFLFEMHQKNIYQQRSPAAKMNMHRLVDHILETYRTKLYSPQLNAVRGWKSYNPLE